MTNSRMDKSEVVELEIGGSLKIPYQMYQGMAKYVKESQATAREVMEAERTTKDKATAGEITAELTR